MNRPEEYGPHWDGFGKRYGNAAHRSLYRQRHRSSDWVLCGEKTRDISAPPASLSKGE